MPNRRYRPVLRIRMFLALLDPDPDSVGRGTVPIQLRLRILLQADKNSKKNLNSSCFVTSDPYQNVTDPQHWYRHFVMYPE